MPVREVPASPEQLALRLWLHTRAGRAVADVRDEWEERWDGTLTVLTPANAVLDPADDAGWVMCRTAIAPDLCDAIQAGEPDVTVIAYEGTCPPQEGHAVPVEYVACPPPITARLYPSEHQAGSGATPESFASPNLGISDISADWEYHTGGGYEAFQLYDTPAATTTGAAATWSATNAAAGDAALRGFVHRLDGDLLAIVRAGGTVRGQVLARARSGIGISEGAQQHFSKWTARVYRPGTGFVATLWTVGSGTGASNWPAQATWVNKSFTAAFAGYAAAVEGDYVVIEFGARHVAPTTGGTGAALFFVDNAASDLPEDEVTTTVLRSWVEFST